MISQAKSTRKQRISIFVALIAVISTLLGIGAVSSSQAATPIQVTFNSNRGVGSMPAQTLVPGETLNLNTFTRTNYKFVGWSTSTVGPINYSDGAVVTSTANLSLYARWTVETRLVSFNANGGTGSMTAQTVPVTGATLKLNSYLRSGYRFGGWSLTANGPVVYSNATTLYPTTDLELFAIWLPITYQLSFNANGGSGTTAGLTFTASGVQLPVSNFARSGYTFSGWSKSATGTNLLQPGDLYSTPGNVVLYAIWLKAAVVPGAPAVTGHSVGALIWSDEFSGASGSAVNPNVWTNRYCGQSPANGGGTCYNSEQQYFTPAATKLDGAGSVVITTNKISSPPADSGSCYVAVCNFTSGRFDTQGKVSFQYGYIETRMKMPAGGANWPAFWMLGDNITSAGWPYSGEVDIAEQGGNLPMRNTAAVHYSTNGIPGSCCGNATYDSGQLTNVSNYQTGYHTYGLAWLPDTLEFYVDGRKFLTVSRSSIRSSQWAFNSPFFLIYDNAVGNFGGTYSGWTQSKTSIDYVRVWSLDGQGTVIFH